MLHRSYQILLWTLLLAAPLAVGSVHTHVVLGLATGALLVLGLQARVLGRKNLDHIILSLPSLAFWLFAALCVLQIIPLPGGVSALLSPTRARHVHDAWHHVFASAPPSTWAPLSLDPAASADRGLRWLTVGLVGLLGANHARLPNAWRDTLRALTLGGCLVLLVGALQTFSGTEKILFLYLPRAPIRPFSTFVNPNQAAVFYGLCALAAFALAFERFARRLREAVAASAAGLVLMVAMAEQDSTGANLGFAMAFLALCAFFLQGKQSEKIMRRDRARRLAAVLLSLPILMPLLAFMALRVGPPRLAQFLGDTALGIWAQERGNARLEMMAAALEGAADYPINGAGAGATLRGLPAYLDWSAVRPATIPTIENETVQWAFEFGWPAAVLAILLLASYLWFFARGHLRGRKTSYGVGLAAVIFLAFNTQFHFPFFALGIAVPGAFWLESAIGRAYRGGDFDKQDLYRGLICYPKRLFLPVFVGFWAFAGIFWAATHYYAVDASELKDCGSLAKMSSERAEDSENCHDTVARLLQLAPTDAEVLGYAARIAEKSGDPERARDIALQAARVNPNARHQLLAAAKMWRTGQKEAAMERYLLVFSPAYQQLPAGWISQAVCPTLGDAHALAHALKNAEPAQWQAAASATRQQQGLAAAIDFSLTLVELRPDHATPYTLLIGAYLSGKQYDLAELWARLLIARDLPDAQGARPAGYPELARAIASQGQRARAHQVALDAVDAVGISQAAGELLVNLRSAEPRLAPDQEARALGLFHQQFCANPSRRVLRQQCWLAEGWLAERAERHTDAQFAFERIARKHNDPLPLAQFFTRLGRCVDLNELIAQLQRDRDRTPAHILRLTAECARRKSATPSKTP